MEGSLVEWANFRKGELVFRPHYFRRVPLGSLMGPFELEVQVTSSHFWCSYLLFVIPEINAYRIVLKNSSAHLCITLHAQCFAVGFRLYEPVPIDKCKCRHIRQSRFVGGHPARNAQPYLPQMFDYASEDPFAL